MLSRYLLNLLEHTTKNKQCIDSLVPLLSSAEQYGSIVCGTSHRIDNINLHKPWSSLPNVMKYNRGLNVKMELILKYKKEIDDIRLQKVLDDQPVDVLHLQSPYKVVDISIDTIHKSISSKYPGLFDSLVFGGISLLWNSGEIEFGEKNIYVLNRIRDKIGSYHYPLPKSTIIPNNALICKQNEIVDSFLKIKLDENDRMLC